MRYQVECRGCGKKAELPTWDPSDETVPEGWLRASFSWAGRRRTMAACSRECVSMVQTWHRRNVQAEASRTLAHIDEATFR